MDWTGPGLFTDVIMEYMEEQYQLKPEDFSAIGEPVQIGDVLVLPLTAFSPDMGHMGSKPSDGPGSLVKHHFAGTWKKK